ncbi:MAG: Cna B-type domain-containing protein [Oscillibacter sp.]|nr:Cna B-type domain-containing protein [Oscillibacter sp.]
MFLSLAVVLAVFWWLKLTGITMAGEAFCGMAEHVHGEKCQTVVLICPLEEEEAHLHNESCILWECICEGEECPPHTHSETCLEQELSCSLTEAEGHIHDDLCYTLLEGSYICGQEETEGHVHGNDCWRQGVGFGCGLTEADGHIHTAECLTEETQLICGKDATEGHTHGELCYQELEECPLEEHIHVESCYSNLDVDVETANVWEMSLADVERGISTAETVVAVARSQLGYTESSQNFEVDLHGVRRGITRYGQWYGNPYGDWSAMFASFCLHYAGADDLPTNAGAESMRLEWADAELYRAAEDYSPKVGNLMFLRPETAAEGEVPEEEGLPVEQSQSVAYDPEAAEARTVAIIAAVEGDSVTVIQGDLDNAVVEYTLPMESPNILGYGLVPEQSPFMMMTARASDLEFVARTIPYSSNIFTSGRSFVVYTQRDGVYYAFDGNGNAIPVEIDGDGNIRTDIADPESLLWNFTRNGTSYVISNLSTGRHIHPFYNSGTDYGITTSTGWNTDVVASGGGAILRHSAYARLNTAGTAFEMTRSQASASVFQFGVAERCTIWLDGTNGNLMSLQGSAKESRSVTVGETIRLPEQWPSPEKYSYTLRGWYDVRNGTYYAPGDEVTVTEELLFYADWAASTYDIGQMNEAVVDTVSTADFITTHVFDYNSLFNVLSMDNNYTGGDTTRWTLVEDGPVQASGDDSLNFIFVDYDNPGNPGAISYPVGRNQANGVDYTVVTPGLYDDDLARLLFDRNVEVAGKHYIGEGDHLFQYGSDPSDSEHYGYFYYDSMLNAASYHQGNGRFYVYDYLERTVDSANNSPYSDFLPLNSPYANTNGKTTGTYSYNGVHNEYVGTTHLSYDSKYSDRDNSPNRIVTNYWFGMTIEMDFYLPAVPGTVDSEGVRANQSITGEDMVFEFSGDDDVWVLIDGELVLDIGGIHGVEAGSIDFSTGDVIVDGVKTGTVTGLDAGSHTLTMYYLERGSSMSNFKLRFNLSTRYSMTMRKEDTLTAHLLDGAQFAVYTDETCNHPAELWDSREAHERGDPATNIFTVDGGVAAMWGFAAGNTYYFEEIRGPDAMNGMTANGIIRMRLNNQGLPDYEILANADGDLTVGYMVHGYKVSEDTQEAYLVITNTDAVDSEPTEVYVEKRWADSVNHSSDSVTVYLAANGIRIQAVTLNDANDWKHTWVNLPKTDANGNEIQYTVREATVPGYVGEVEKIGASPGGGGSSDGGTSVSGFVNGQTYLLQTRFGYIGASDNKPLLEGSQANAQNSAQTQWVASVHSDGTVTLTNKTGQTLYYDNYTFKASSSPGTYRNLRFSDGKLYCYIDHGGWSETQYPVDNDNVANNLTYNGVFYTTNDSVQALSITPQLLGTPEPEPPPSTDDGGGNSFRITNTPAGEAVISLQVKKIWDLGSMGVLSDYEELTIEMRLLADGEDAGLVGMLNLRNGWTHTFEDLPKYNNSGHEIAYTVEEINLPSGWSAEYGPVTSVGNSETAYETTVTNICRKTVELPTTGGIGPYGYIMLGVLIMLGSLGWYCGQRRKCERREF